MTKVNKNLLLFLCIAVGLGISMIAVLTKLLPLFIEHTVYYCQRLAGLITLEFPHQISLIVITFFAALFVFTTIRLVWLFIEIHLLKRKLVRLSSNKFQISDLVRRHKLQNNVYLIANERSFAFCFGILNPKMYLSTKMISQMNKKEIEAILLHEKYHLDNKDSLIMLFATVLLHLFPFFPILSDLIRNYKIQREIEADKQAIQLLGKEHIVGVLKKLLQIPMITFPAASALAEYETLKPRIKAVIGEEYSYSYFSKVKMLISLFTVTIIIGILTLPVHAEEMHNSKEEITMVCLHDNTCISACTNKHTLPIYTAPYSADNESHPYSSAR